MRTKQKNATGHDARDTQFPAARRTTKRKAIAPVTPIDRLPSAQTKARTRSASLPMDGMSGHETNGRASMHATPTPQLPAHDTPQASTTLTTRSGSPAANTNGDGQSSPDTHFTSAVAANKRRGGHRSPGTQTSTAPASERTGVGHLTPGTHGRNAHPFNTEADAGQPDPDTHALAARSALIYRIIELYAHRRAAIKAQIRLTNAARAFVRRAAGWRMDLPDAERAKINRLAEKIVKAIEKGKAPENGEAPVQSSVAPFVTVCQQSRKQFDAYRDRIEKALKEAVRQLPVAAWVDQVKGFGEMGLAIIVGEAGDLGQYANPGKLWKRMGVAPVHCYDDVTKNGEKCNKKPKARRSALYTIGDSIIKCSDSPLRPVYLDRKAYELARAPDMKPIHAHRRAQRYMEKRLLRDLWRAWNSRPRI